MANCKITTILLYKTLQLLHSSEYTRRWLYFTSPQKLSVKIAKDLGMYKKAKKQVVSNQYFDPSQIVGDQHS